MGHAKEEEVSALLHSLAANTGIAEHLVLVAAIGIDGEGVKHPLGLIEGATEHGAVVQA